MAHNMTTYSGRKSRSLDRAIDKDSAGSSPDRLPMDITTESQVEHVLGMTVFSNSALTSDPVSGVVAYPAGSMLILLDCLKNKQSCSLHCPGKIITAVAFSPDGKLLVTGESGHKGEVRVWRKDTMQETASFGQFTGIEFVAFSPSMTEIVVVGNVQDISVWSWPELIMLSLNKLSDKVQGLSVSNDAMSFVTASNRQLKFYSMDSNPDIRAAPMPLSTRCVFLDVLLPDDYLCDVVCGSDENSYVFAVSSFGLLCQTSLHRRLERWVNVETQRAFCLSADREYVYVGCGGGVIRMFLAATLEIVTTLPQPHSLGVDISQYSVPNCERGDTLTTEVVGKDGACYPAVKAMAYDPVNGNLTVIYDDCSLYIWNRTGKTFKKYYSSLFHCGCIWDFSLYPLPKDESSSEEKGGGALPPGSLITVSADGTLRSWDVSSNISKDSVLRRNAVSSACLKIVYANSVRKGDQLEPERKDLKRHGSKIPSPASRGHYKTSVRKEGRSVISVVSVCPDGSHIATGNGKGQLTIYDAFSMETLTVLAAHDAEVTVVSYTSTVKYKILASGSRDRMIHLMDAANNYQLMSTLDDHSSTITAIHFTSISRYVIMVSSSLDMSVLARTYVNDKSLTFSHVRAIAVKKAVVDFTLHPWSGQVALVCQDKMVHIHSILRTRESFSYRGCLNEAGNLVKISTDPSGQYILTACTKKTISLIEFDTGEILRTFSGHAESVTRVQFSLNMKYVISSSSDGCIFFWKLPLTVAYSVKLVMAEMGLLKRGMVLGEEWKKSSAVTNRPCNKALTMSPRKQDPSETAVERASTSSLMPKSGESTSIVWNNSEISLSEVWISPGYGIFHNIQSLDSLNKLLESDELCYKSSSLDQALGSSMDTWMTKCYRRRELFKLEARSIKRTLTMMRLVADAMEKNLQEDSIPKSAKQYPTTTENNPQDQVDNSEDHDNTITTVAIPSPNLNKSVTKSGIKLSLAFTSHSDTKEDNSDETKEDFPSLPSSKENSTSDQIAKTADDFVSYHMISE